MDIEQIYKKAEREVDQAAVSVIKTEVTQVRFSNNKIDISNRWNVEGASVFLAKEGRTFMFDLKDENDIDRTLSFSLKALKNSGKNEDFYSLSDRRYSYRKPSTNNVKLRAIDEESFVNDFIDQIRPFVKRTGGVFYKKDMTQEVKTPFNQGSQETYGVEFVARAFSGPDYPVQISFMTSTDRDISMLHKQGDEIIDMARNIKNVKEGKDGKYNVIFHPLCFASIVSYTIPMASAFQVDSGMSFFANRMGERVGNSAFTMYDDPTDDSMIGARVFDDEGTSTRKTPVIEKGQVKNYLHNYSTAKKYGTETTGNAGIVAPTPWQISVEPGNEELDDMISSTKKGLYIVNTWYTRFQDYREGVFSTIPRDGIFLIENGEIRETWNGIRISDSLLNIYKHIEGISRETKSVKWWDETLPTRSPFVSVSEVNISRSK
jgi:PmbA protein